MLSSANACFTRSRVLPTCRRKVGSLLRNSKRQLPVLPQQPVQFGSAFQGQQQLFRMPGFQQILVDAGLVDAGDDVLAVGVAGDDDAHRVRPVLPDFLQQFDAADFRHALVGQDNIDVAARQDRAGFGGAGGGENLEIFFQRPAQCFL
jgi:hypothetical protein